MMDTFNNSPDLGDYEAEFHTRSGCRFTLAGFCLALATALSICSYLTVSADTRGLALVLMPAIIVPLILGSLYLLFLKKTLVLYRNGLVWKSKTSDEAITWDSIKHIRETRTTWHGLFETSRSIRIETESGTKIGLDGLFQRLDFLSNTIRTRTLPSLLKRAELKLANRSGVVFDKLTVFSDGFENGKERISWDEVVKLTISKNFPEKWYQLAIFKSGQRSAWFTKALPGFPNIELFIILVNRFIPDRMIPPVTVEITLPTPLTPDNLARFPAGSIPSREDLRIVVHRNQRSVNESTQPDLSFCVFDDNDEDVASFDLGYHSDFEIFLDIIKSKIPGATIKYALLMQPANGEGEWAPEDLPKLEKELVQIAAFFKKLPPEPIKNAFERVSYCRENAKSLYDCFHNLVEENLFEALTNLCRVGIEMKKPICFQ